MRGAAAGAWLAGAAAFVPQGVPCPAAPQLAAGRYAHSAAQLCRAAAAAHARSVHLCRSGQPAVGNCRRNKFLLTVFELAATFFVCQGLYAAADLTDLLLASCGEEVRTNRTLTTLLNKVYKVLIVVLGVMTMAQESGLPVGSIVASAGLVGLTISLAAQDSAKNLFSGLVILLDRPFSIGDWITVGDVSGEVVDINFRSTKVRALDNSVYILTNSTVSSATINNGTLRNKRLYRFTLGVTYDTTRPQLEQLMTDLTAMLKASPYTYEDSVLVKLSGFGASSIDLLVSAYLRTADMTRFLQMQNDLNLDLMDVMQKNGVDFAFPSTTVYLEKNN